MQIKSNEDPERQFERTRTGDFMYRFGSGGPDISHSEKKVCLVATDKTFLAALLHELSMRDDCYYVKYSIVPREGMYLGRCFLTTDEAAGRLCSEYKGHPKLMVTLQDDEFFNKFR